MKSETVYLQLKMIYLCYSLCDVSHIFVHVIIVCMYNKLSCSSRTTTVFIRTRNTMLFCPIKLFDFDLTLAFVGTYPQSANQLVKSAMTFEPYKIT